MKLSNDFMNMYVLCKMLSENYFLQHNHPSGSTIKEIVERFLRSGSMQDQRAK